MFHLSRTTPLYFRRFGCTCQRYVLLPTRLRTFGDITSHRDRQMSQHYLQTEVLKFQSFSYFSAATASFRCHRHRLCDCLCHFPVKNIWQDAILPGFFDKVCNRMRCCNLHLIGNPGGPGIERTSEYTRKCEHIIDLVGKITSSGSDNTAARRSMLHQAISPVPDLPLQTR